MSTSEESPPPGDFDPSSLEPAKAAMAALAKAPIGDSLEGVEVAVVSGVSEVGGKVAGMLLETVDPAFDVTGPASTDSGTLAKGISKRVEVWSRWVKLLLFGREPCEVPLVLDLSTTLLVLTVSMGLVLVDPAVEVDDGCTGLPGIVSAQARSRSSPPWTPLTSSAVTVLPLFPVPLFIEAADFVNFLDALLLPAEIALFSLRLEVLLRIKGSSSSTTVGEVTGASESSTNNLRLDFFSGFSTVETVVA